MIFVYNIHDTIGGYMIRVGEVIKSNNGICTIKFSKLESCKSCGQCNHANTDSIIDLEGDYLLGDYVEVCIPDNQLIKASSIAYVFPLIMLILGLYVGSLISKSEYIIALSSFIGVGIALLIINIAERLRNHKASWSPYIVGLAANSKSPSNSNIELLNINLNKEK